MRLAGGTGEQAIVADAMETLGQDVEQEPTNELVGGERHDLLAVGTAAAVILKAEGDAGLVEAQEAAVRDRDPVGVARQIGEHRLWPGERRFGINHPALLPDRRQMPQKRTPVGEMREAAEEGEAPGPVNSRP